MTTHQLNPATGVLIVDDHDGYRSAAADVVKATQGYVVAGCAAGRSQALAVLDDRNADVGLILMDVNLGDDDGVSLTREITTRSADVVVVLVTTLAIDDLPQSARDCGARGYLPKVKLSPSTLVHLTHGVYDWPDDDPARGASRRS